MLNTVHVHHLTDSHHNPGGSLGGWYCYSPLDKKADQISEKTVAYSRLQSDCVTIGPMSSESESAHDTQRTSNGHSEVQNQRKTFGHE